MKADYFECDECSTRTRRITIHTSEMPALRSDGGMIAEDDLHFCGTLCMNTYVRNTLNGGNLPPAAVEANVYWLTGQDIRDGA